MGGVPRSLPRRRGARPRPRGVLTYSVFYPLRSVALVVVVLPALLSSALRLISTVQLAVASMPVALVVVVVVRFVP